MNKTEVLSRIRGFYSNIVDSGVNVEVETRIGNITKKTFLETLLKFKTVDNPIETHTIEKTAANIRHVSVMDNEDVQEEYVEEKIKETFNTEYSFRVGIATEKRINDDFNEFRYIIRDKKRISYVLGNIRYDFTVVDTTDDEITKTTYEIELESTIEHVDQLYEDTKQFILKIFGGNFLINNTEREDVIMEINNILGISSRFLSASIVNKPKDLKFNDLNSKGLHLPYAVSYKADGIRKLMYVSKSGMYLIYPPDVMKMSEDITSDIDYLIDVEYMENGRILAFDMLVYDGDIRHKNLNERLDILKTVEKDLVEKGVEKFSVKKYSFIANNFQDNVRKFLADKPDFEDDGLIFTPVNAPYISENRTKNNFFNPSLVKKWKPMDKISIDFEIMEGGFLGVKNFENEIVKFDGTPNIPYKDVVHKFDTGLIIEFGWDQENNSFVDMRKREDKIEPNFVTVSQDVWRLIHNPISKNTLIGNDLVLMRKFHNIYKTEILNTLKRRGVGRVLDLGSGRGGDVNKWARNMFKVFAVEPSLEYITGKDGLMDRLEAHSHTDMVSVVHAKAEELEKIKDSVGNSRIDLISMFNSLTFFYDTDDHVDQLIRTIKEFSSKGTYFIAMAVDGKRIDKMLGTRGFFKSNNLSIKKLEGRAISVTINVPMVPPNQLEFLVDFDDFIFRMRKEGFRLEHSEYMDTNDFLSPMEFLYSSATRIVIFKYDPLSNINKKRIVHEKRMSYLMQQISSKRFIREPLKDGEIERFKNTMFGDIVRIGTIRDGSCFFHAILYALSSEYRNANSVMRMQIVAQFRTNLKSKFTKAVYNNLGNGNLASLDMLDFSYETMKENLGNPTEYVGNEFLEFVSDVIGVNIRFISGNNPKVYNHGEDRSIVYRTSRSNIIIYWQGDNHYELIGEINQENIRVLFSDKDAIINKF
jgi:SAM-dependent methyltransferase